MIDLHTHSRASDGTLSPAELVSLAAARGVTLLSLTDHDCLDGMAEARAACATAGIRFLPGVEVSTSWDGKTLHIVGLGVDPENTALKAGLARLQAVRDARGAEIGKRLEAKGIVGAYAGAARIADEARLTRTHYARFLLEAGHVKDLQQAYRRYLGRGKPGHVSVEWASLEETLDWIHAAGGRAVLAHPLRYGFTRAWLTKILTAFKQAGGDALEVISGRSNPDEIAVSAHLAARFELMGSVGSDFHAPTQWLQPGVETPLPAGVKPVWESLSA
ncbi:MAG TPA: PHP domain-containing protein [Gammaproteobacteria bacterium]|nr:PHP domain-containing protein [Gammaproteobacteria bacterium]